MTKSREQRAKKGTGSKGRLAALGFVLFIVLLCACNGGYEPEVGGEDVIIPVYGATTHQLSNVIVKIPGKIAYEIKQGKNEGYAVVWKPNVGQVYADTEKGGENAPVSSGYKIDKTTYFLFGDLSIPAITIEVYKCLPDESDALIPGPLVATKVVPTIAPTP